MAGLNEEVDVELRAALAHFPANELSDHTVDARRKDFGAFIAKDIPVVDGLDIKFLKVPGPKDAPEISLYTYTPFPCPVNNVPAFLWIHGGAFALGDAAQDHPRVIGIAKELGFVTVNVNYRLAPENRFPAAIEDVYAALKWMNLNADTLGIDVNRIAIGGGSAGGALAAALALLVRDRREFKVAFQVLIYPTLDDRETYRAGRHPNAGKHVVPAAMVTYAWKALLGNGVPGTDEVSPYAAAIRAKSLAGLPPAYISIGELDILRDECIAYAQRLWNEGISTELHIVPKAYHGFDWVPQATVSKKLEEHIKYILKRELLSDQK